MGAATKQKQITVNILHSFTENKSGGNPAGVVLHADNFTEKQMQQIAKEINFSETAFVSNSSKANFHVRFFTPTEEVNLCGHATIATFYLMFLKSLITLGIYYQETKAGILKIEIQQDGSIMMQQTKPEFFEYLPIEEIAFVLGIPEEYMFKTKLQPQVVSTGSRELLVPIDTREHLFAIRLEFNKIAKYNEKTDTSGMHVFTFDIINKQSIAHARNFSPRCGINEESATGICTGALACYLYKHNCISNNRVNRLIFEQGYCMIKPSELIGQLVIKDNLIENIYIGGKAIFVGEKQIYL